MARAYLWQNGKMMDLNSLVAGGEPLYLIFACHINDGFGAASTGDVHAFSATPIHTAGPREDVHTAAPAAFVTLEMTSRIADSTRFRRTINAFSST
jgi:hypothetical protein